jgi:hypothetical protein
VRQDRTHNEAIVNARPEEQAMSWHSYIESKIRFPFPARSVGEKRRLAAAEGGNRRGLTDDPRMPASMKCLYKSVGGAEDGPSHSLSLALIDPRELSD